MSCIIVIPARLESKRLPRKLLADIGGKPLLRHVVERCLLSKASFKVVLVTDSEEIKAAMDSWGLIDQVPVLLSSAECSSGTERIASVLSQILDISKQSSKQSSVDNWILNVQGDQPFIDPTVIDALASSCSISNAEVLTPVYRLSPEKIHDPAVVKCLFASNSQCLTFSRSALPHVRDVAPENWHLHAKYWGHVGIYAYRVEVLRRWSKLPASPLEQAEKLEQLRLLEAGISIQGLQVDGDSISIDTADQLALARKIASASSRTAP
jgi:3-deoxy-manno-octulosonate cytidylyltransferase (CMP-KDO synthetase)